MIHLVVRRSGTLLGRDIQPGDVLCIDLESSAPIVLGVELPRNIGQVLGAMVEGSVEPVDITPDAARDLLAPRTSAARPPRVLDLRPRLGSASAG